MTPIFPVISILGIIIIVLLIGIILNHIRKKNRAKRSLAGFYGLANEFNFFISKQEEFGSRILGLDDIKNQLLYFSTTGYKHEGYLIDLDEVKTSTVYVFNNSDTENKSNMNPHISKIILQLDYKRKVKPLAL